MFYCFILTLSNIHGGKKLGTTVLRSSLNTVAYSLDTSLVSLSYKQLQENQLDLFWHFFQSVCLYRAQLFSSFDLLKSSLINWSTQVKKLMKAYIVILSWGIPNVSPVPDLFNAVFESSYHGVL